MQTDDERIEARRKKLFIYARMFGLDRDERLEFAQLLLHRDINSWQDLTDQQMGRLLDAFEGAALLNHLLTTR